jgi:hypothetical protein
MRRRYSSRFLAPVACVILLAFSSTRSIALAQVPDTTRRDSTLVFLRLPMGSSEVSLHTNFIWGCTNYPQTEQALDLFMADRACSPIDDPKAPGKYNLMAKFDDWAGIPPLFYTLYYWHDRLSLVVITFDSRLFGTVIETVRARYGAPVVSTTDTVRTGIGIAVPRQVMRWETRLAALNAVQYADKLDRSEVRYTLRSWEDTSEARRKERLKTKLP